LQKIFAEIHFCIFFLFGRAGAAAGFPRPNKNDDNENGIFVSLPP
jgi:hypothetical protein